MTTTPPNTSPTATPSPPPEPPPVLAPIPPPSVPPSPTPPLAPTDLVPPSFAPPSMSISPQSPMSASSPEGKPPPVPPPTSAGTSPPPSVTNPPQSSPPPSTSTPPQNSPPPLIANTPPSSTPTQASTPPQHNSPPPAVKNPPQTSSPPAPQTSSPPPTSPPPPQTSSPPPPKTSSPPPTSPPPPQTSSPPPTSPPPPQTSSPPPPQTSSPPPPRSAPTPEKSPPTPVINTPKSSPSPAASAPPPHYSPKSPVPEPPPSSPPPPRADPPESPPPPPSSTHFPSPASPVSSPSKPPSNSPSAPPSTPKKDAPPPPIPTPRNPTPAPSSPKSIPRPLPPPPPLRLGSPSSFLHPPPSPSPFVNPALEENSKSRHSNGIGVGVIAAISVSVVVIILILIGLSIWCMKWRKVASGGNGGYIMPAYSSDSNLKMGSPAPLMGSSASLMGNGSSSDIFISPTQSDRLDSSKTWFTYEEIVKATNGFSSQNLLGKGGFGSVYKGCLPDGREVAVKQLNIWGGQGEREFKAEVEIISRIHHRHLVSLVGYCISESQRLLLYDYVPNNTLHFHLHGEGGPGLDWATRFRIALGAARGLAYLHEDCDPRVIHRDIKSSNILLDDKFEAKVSDFGLAKMAVDANTHVTTRVMGTFGYMAPEYASTGRLTEKSDVFSFGVVLLELITGRKPVDTTRPLGDESLVEWARPLLNDVQESEGIDGLVDPRLGKNYIESEMLRMMEAAAACVRHSAATRPRMSQVLRAFESSHSVDLTNGMRVGSSLVFNSDVQSEQIRLFQRMAGGNMNYTTDFFSLESYNTQR